MTYSHKSVVRNNIKMTTTSATATKGGAGEFSSSAGAGGGGGGNGIDVTNDGNLVGTIEINNSYFINSIANNKKHIQNNNRRMSPTTAAAAASSSSPSTTPTTFTTNALPILTASHSNSIACSTNIQQHPLMSVSPPDNGSYFGNQQRKQRYNSSQWQTPNQNSNSSVGGGSGSGSSDGSSSVFFTKTNSGQNRRSKQGTAATLQFRTPNHRSPNGGQGMTTASATATLAMHHSPATVLGGGVSEKSKFNSGGSGSGGGASSSTGRKRRPKLHFQSPLINMPSDLGVGGNISPTHPLLPSVLTHFAGSKCFDAPAPSAVPKPPQHWVKIDGSNIEQKSASSAGPGLKNVINAHNEAINMKSRSAAAAMMMAASKSNITGAGAGHIFKSSKRNLLDDFDTHNLKLLLNVQS